MTEVLDVLSRLAVLTFVLTSAPPAPYTHAPVGGAVRPVGV
jgi:hypothetical protein